MLDIIKEICKRQDEILSNIVPESIAVYLFLKNEYAKDDIGNNTVFQFVFRSYYSLDGAGLSSKWKKHFFELLEQQEDSLRTILQRLYRIKTLTGRNTVQFSFATKLLHTLDNTKPIFDLKVAKVIGETVTGVNENTRIESCIRIYKRLEYIYRTLLKADKIKRVIRKFRKKFHINEEQIEDLKILDFIIWTLGKLKTKNAKKKV